MKRHTTMWTVILTCALGATAPPALARTGAQDAATEAMIKAGQPGDEHKALGWFVGAWTTETKAFMGPGDPAVAKGKADFTAVLGNRFVRQVFQSDFMGQPFEGLGYTGYDNVAKAYVTTWTDSMSTGIVRLTGPYDAASKTYTFSGSYPDPLSKKEKAVKMTIRGVDTSHFVMEWFEPGPDGKLAKMLEVSYARAQ